jgi:hypothetical protein
MDKITSKELIEDIQRLAGKFSGKVTRKLYRSQGVYSERTYRKVFTNFTDFLNAAGMCSAQPSSKPNETSEISGDKWIISLPKTRISTEAELIAHCKIDLSVWHIDKCIFNKWEVGAKDADGELQISPLFQVKAFCSKKTNIVDAKKEIEELKSLAKENAPRPAFVLVKKQPSGNMLEVNMPDMHFGKLAWGTETGYKNYDTKIAANLYNKALGSLLSRSAGYAFDEVLYVVGNDILNSDDAESQTASGTVVTTDGRYQKTFATVRDVMIESIERLRQIAPVKVVMVPGNHDTLSVWHLGDSLECWFHNYSDVKIDNMPRYRKYHRFGNVLLMLTHGDKGKKNEYPILMATECSKDFGETKFREAHIGHIHQTRLEEKYGVRVRTLSSLCEPDDWHSLNGFVGNIRSAEGFIWNRNEGLIGTVIYTDVD